MKALPRTTGLLLVLVSACGGRVDAPGAVAAEPGGPPVASDAPPDVAPPPSTAPAFSSIPPHVPELIGGADLVTSLTVDDRFVSWTAGAEEGVVTSWDKSTRRGRIAAERQVRPRAVRTANGRLSWIVDGAVRATATAGGPVTELAVLPGAVALATAGRSLFVLEGARGEVSAIPEAGGALRVVALAHGSRLLAADASHLYYGDDWIESVAIEGGFPVRLAQPCVSHDALVLDDARVYVACSDGTVHSASRSGGDSRLLFRRPGGGVGRLPGLAVDDGFVYVTSERDAAVYRFPKEGARKDGDARVLAASQDGVGPIAVDARHVYFAAAGVHSIGAVARIPKD